MTTIIGENPSARTGSARAHHGPFRVGIGGPVGSGKTALVEALCRRLREFYDLYVIDVAAGEKIPRKGGPGITRSDLLVINKIDLAPMVGANLDVMEADARRMRGTRPFFFSNLKSGKGVDEIVHFILQKGGLTMTDL